MRGLYRLKVTGYKLQVASYKLQVTGHKLQATSCTLQAASYKLQATSYKLQGGRVHGRKEPADVLPLRHVIQHPRGRSRPDVARAHGSVHRDARGAAAARVLAGLEVSDAAALGRCSCPTYMDRSYACVRACVRA